ncbi:MAG: threonine aldolase family protein [Sphingomonadales bacterium]
MNFQSDNASGVSPEILDALARVNDGFAASYGADQTTSGLTALFSNFFEREVTVFPVVTGTAANALSLAMLTPPHGSVLCHRLSHISEHECGAPEFYTGGGRLILLDGPGAKIEPSTVDRAIARIWRGSEHMMQPAALSLTQTTELGTVYRIDELETLCETARRHDLSVHLDGARLANAMVHLGCSPAETTWKAGIDVLSFGATKNGAMAAEAVVFFDPERAADFLYRRKRGGHLISKMRFLSVQLEAYLTDDLWRRNAEHANGLASRLGDGLAALPGVSLQSPVEANIVFVWMPGRLAEALAAEGYLFHVMDEADGKSMVRLVTAFSSDAGDVDRFLETAKRLSLELR